MHVMHYTNLVRGRLVQYKNISLCIFREMSSLQVRSTVRPASYAAWELRQEVATAIAKIKRLKRKFKIYSTG